MKTIILTSVLALFAMVAVAEEAGDMKMETSNTAYPLDVCVVSGEPLGSMGDPVIYDHNGREVRFCCANCVSSFEKEPAKYVKQIDDAVIAQQSDSYPLDVCVVSGEPLGSMGEPYNYVHGNRLVKFCCSGCIDSFEKDPAKYLKKIDAGMGEMPMDEHHGHMHD